MKAKSDSSFEQFTNEINSMKNYFTDLSKNAELDKNSVDNLTEKIDNFINESTQDEMTMMATTMKTFSTLLSCAYGDQNKLFSDLTLQLDTIHGQVKDEKAKIDEIYEENTNILNGINKNIDEKSKELETIYDQMMKIEKTRNSQKSPEPTRKAKKEMLKLYSDFLNRKEEILMSNSEKFHFQVNFDKKEEDLCNKLALSQNDGINRMHVICVTASNTISTQFQSMQIPKLSGIAHKEPSRLKFRDFKMPVFKPYNFKSKSVNITIHPQYLTYCSVIPYGVAVLTSDYVNNNVELKEGTHVFLLDNSDRDFVPVALNASTSPFFISKSLIKVISKGVPRLQNASNQSPQRININDF